MKSEDQNNLEIGQKTLFYPNLSSGLVCSLPQGTFVIEEKDIDNLISVLKLNYPLKFQKISNDERF